MLESIRQMKKKTRAAAQWGLIETKVVHVGEIERSAKRTATTSDRKKANCKPR